MRLFVLKKKHLIPLCGIFMAIGIVCVLKMSPHSAQTAAVKRELPIYCVATDDKKVALSFDAAWGTRIQNFLLKF